MPSAKLYRPNAEEQRILALARDGHVEYFTDYYLRGPNSGTWWFPGAKNEKWKRGYERLLSHWEKVGMPTDTFVYEDNVYTVHQKHEKSKEYPHLPAFHHNHGFLFLDWQKALHNDRHPIRTIIGGFGSGKTLAIVISMLIHGATLEAFRGFALAPESKQSNEVHKLAVMFLKGTRYAERFLIGHPLRPVAQIIVGHELVGVNTIECYPILNKVDSMLTLTGDMALVDQAEKIENLDEVIRAVGTRFRGRIPETGRERIGTLTFVANSKDNPKLWEIYDEAQVDPENYFSYSPSTYDNPFLTDKDIQRYELQVGNSEEDRRVHLMGGRPLGNGKEFSRAVLERIRDWTLDDEMKYGRDHNLPDYTYLEAKNVGVYEWALPYRPDRHYLVISDPGTADPPHRNSPPIFAWDITDFPKQPARLAAFIWVYGRGDIKNWATRYAETVRYYHAVGRNGFDATGFQSGYDQWISILTGLLSEKIMLTGNHKALCLNSAKMLASSELIKMPGAISAVYGQLARYELPEPNQKLRQDCVMAFIMSCWWMQRLFYMTIGEETHESTTPESPDDRYYRAPEDRVEIVPR